MSNRRANSRRKAGPLEISLRQKTGALSDYWTAQVRRANRGPILFENSNASRAVALAGAENWCNRLGHSYRIREA